ncbi:hypothetical protein RhiirA1_540502 [Rhizophagus irregularis]|uniref:Uncharacterized protein n=1 Tax=Rhizophagus irregularis TaxID=588596 RepID=A0A2N0R7Y8_9GLOM|nr:hypothetical protein RhiirA1_540502 [Rhizophagus irregularis]
MKRQQALVKNKLENEEWSMIAEKVEEKMKQGTIFNDASIEENDLIWERLKSDIVAEIDHVIKEKKSKEICDWKKRSGRKRTKEKRLIQEYKNNVKRFTKLDNWDKVTKEVKIDDKFEDEDKMKMVSSKIRKMKNVIISNFKSYEEKKLSEEIGAKTEYRENLMTTDLGEMIKRVMNKRREQIKVESCQKILDDRVQMVTNHEEIKKEVPIETIDESIYSSLCDEVTDKELVETLKTVKNDKAAGVSGKWVNEWKQGIIYPIKKTMDWNKDLRLTRQ